MEMQLGAGLVEVQPGIGALRIDLFDWGGGKRREEKDGFHITPLGMMLGNVLVSAPSCGRCCHSHKELYGLNPPINMLCNAMLASGGPEWQEGVCL